MTNPSEVAAFELGVTHALERGPKSQKGIKQIRALNEVEYLAYLRGQSHGLRVIQDAALPLPAVISLSDSELEADLNYPVHTEFIAEDNA